MSKILKVYHPDGKNVSLDIMRDIQKEIETITKYSDKIEITFKNRTTIEIRKK